MNFIGIIASLLISSASAASPCSSAEYGYVHSSTPTMDICHSNYLTEYSTKYHSPIIVNWTLTKEELKNCNKRKGSFHRDPEANGQDVSPDEFTDSGFDRGHLTPAEDNLFSNQTEYDSFDMTNITAQNPKLNRNGWKWFENLTRLYAFQYDKVVVYSGVIFKTDNYMKDVRIPDYFWKIVYIPSINKNISILVPNIPVNGEDILDYLSTPKEIETKANVVIPLPLSANKEEMGDNDDVDVTTSDITYSKVCRIF